MPSSFSPNLRIELIGDGEQAGNWGATTNTNLGTLIEQSIAGYVSVAVTTANHAFTYADGASDQARNAMIELTTTTGAAFNVYAPPSPKSYVIYNASAFAATIYNSTAAGNTTPAGVGVIIPAGKRVQVISNGTAFGSTFAASAGSAETAATRPAGDNSTAIATTAFVRAELNALVSIPAGLITMWSGSIASIPGGWALCNGASGTPDLRDRFILGAGGTRAVATTGGSADAIAVAHTHTYSATTGNQSADHTHAFSATTGGQSANHSHSGSTDGVGNHSHSQVGVNNLQTASGGSGAGWASGQTTSTGGAGAHSHSFSTGGVSSDHSHNVSGSTGGMSTSHNHTVSGTTASTGSAGTNANLPPFFVLAYIMKL
jgi:hypothetical protein